MRLIYLNLWLFVRDEYRMRPHRLRNAISLHRRSPWALTGVLAGFALLASATAAFAIPSPELVVGSLTSLSQLTALVSALFGGGAVVIGKQFAGATNVAAVRRLQRLALLLGIAALAGFTAAAVVYTSSAAKERTRLEQTLLRSAPKAAGGETLDPLLKEIPYAAQTTHPRGIATQEAQRIAAEVAAGASREWMILDIRETAETEMGSLPNAVKIRFPDLARANLDLAGKKALLICHNGNRSAETCEALAAKGIDCRFIIGGLEKWLAEGRTLAGFDARTLEDLRAIPDYPNHTVLLDTQGVHDLVKNEGAIFVDVRYPGEFAASHLPDAINVPMRATPTDDLARLIDALPAKPVVAPCYDRRSCFFGEVLGLALTRAGRDFRGRYTVPWEYFVAGKRPPHVEALMIESRKTAWDRAGEALSAALSSLAGIIGLPAALLAMALASRLLVLPFSLKSERDQIAARAIAQEEARLKSALAHDPGRRARALQQLYKSAGVTPLRNLIALLFLPILALAVTAAISAASTVPSRFLWIEDLSGYDESYVLASTFGVLLGVYLHVAFVTRRAHALIVWLAAVPALFAAAAMLPASAALYMTASAVLLLLQRFAVSGVPGWAALKAAHQRRRAARSLMRLGTPHIQLLSSPEHLANAGNKALRLARMSTAGLPVPPGAVLDQHFIAQFLAADAGWRKARLDALWRHFKGRRLAVRSSAAQEDGASLSFAGVFESVLDCDRDGLEAAILAVANSFQAYRGAAYAAAGGSPGAGSANILVQPMVEAKYAGVLFSEDLAEPGQMLVEMVEGRGDSLVSGRITPQVFRIGRLSGRVSGGTPPMDLKPLALIARRAEALFGRPQDIEWAFDGRGFVMLQSRDITAQTEIAGACLVEEQRSLVAQAARHEAATPGTPPVIFHQGDMAELLPRPTPVSLSLLNDMWRSGGSVDLALRALGFDSPMGEDDPPLHVTARGLLYTDALLEKARSPRISRLAARRLTKSLDALDLDFRTRFLPHYLEEAGLLQATDFSRLTGPDLIGAFKRHRARFIEVTHAEVSRINIAAQIALEQAQTALTAHGIDPAPHLAHIPLSDLERALQPACEAMAQGSMLELYSLIGHRAALDYELAQSRYGEDGAGLQNAAALLLATRRPPPVAATAALPAKLARDVQRALNLQTLKEDAKHHCLRDVAVLRAILIAIADRFHLSGAVFFLTLDEIAALNPQNASAAFARGAERANTYETLRAAEPLPERLTQEILEGSRRTDAAGVPGRHAGQRVSGAGTVTGRARVMTQRQAEEGAPIAGFVPGDILVAPFIHPAWLAHVVEAGGVVSRIGGWLSHMAIVAREHGVAMIVGVDGLSDIEDGAMIALTADGRVMDAGPEPAARMIADAAE